MKPKTELCPTCQAGYMQPRELNDTSSALMCGNCGYVREKNEQP